jgi:AcrR family transcriptional regulator
MTDTASLPPSTPKRNLLLDTANRLFYRDGYHAVGIDTILTESGLAKMTLYHHFSSKEELIVAALERRGREVTAELKEAIEAAGSSPRKRLLAVFDWHEHWFRRKDFNGCGFIRAVGEYPDIKSQIHQVVIRRKQATRDMLEALLTAMNIASAKTLAGQIQLLLEGAIVTAHTSGDPTVIALARDAALVLIKAP